jgi:hypothetical protein
MLKKYFFLYRKIVQTHYKLRVLTVDQVQIYVRSRIVFQGVLPPNKNIVLAPAPDPALYCQSNKKSNPFLRFFFLLLHHSCQIVSKLTGQSSRKTGT